ncbi:HAD-IIIC family phosphatase [Ruminococcaceae bacterium OttesenSCG-928-O06]|nr:HAD-IIIC family phosphatase [Ruminococcaceae bacterium OttesenSCG-928-O06]
MDLLEYPFDAAAVLQKKRALKKELLQKEGLIDKKVAIVSGSTVGDIRGVLELFLLHAGIRPTFFEGGFGLFYEDVVFDDGSLAAFAPDVLYIHTSSRNLKHWPDPADTPATAGEKLQREYATYEAVWKAAQKLGCPVVQNNFEAPVWRNFGNMDAWDVRGRVRHTRQLNELLAAYAGQTPGFYIHDFAWLASVYGLNSWCDDAAWYAYKYALAPAHIPHLCHSLASLIKSLFGLSKKGVVSDLDNTLWGGVVGEAGPEGIEFGDESPAGMAYAEFQSYLAMLSRRGILLNVASKNEQAAAEAGLARADSVLHKEDFLRFEAHWGPKSQSVATIASALNIGADSLVFVDDNPAEREEVQRALPFVAAPPIAQPEDSIRLLDRGGYFEATALSADDAARTEMYRQNAARAAEKDSFADYSGYLHSLAMQAQIGPFTPPAPRAHHPTYQQNQPVQPHHPPLHRHRDRPAHGKWRLHHPGRPPYRQVWRQRHHLCPHRPHRRGCARHRGMGDELPGVQAPLRICHVRRAGGRGQTPGHHHAAGALFPHGQKLVGERLLCYNWLCIDGGRRRGPHLYLHAAARL